MKLVALIPLRGGSKSIVDKNIKMIAGKPLCYWTLRAASDSAIFDKIIVSTDSIKIANVVRQFEFEKVFVLDRPSEIAQDTSSTEEVMLHMSQYYDFDILCLIQATSPLTQADDLRRAYHLFNNEQADSLVSGVLTKRFFWDLRANPLNYDPVKRPRRQEFNGTLMENGAYYFTTRQLLLKTHSRLGGKIVVDVMAEENAVELDEAADWVVVEELLLSRQKSNFLEKLQNIKLIATDIDGTLTDGGMFYSEAGDELKKFNTRDGMGFALARRRGLKTALITGEEVTLNKRRAEKIKADYYFSNITDKVQVIEEIAVKENLTLDEICFIGDDVNDLEALKRVGVAFCPANAVSDVCLVAISLKVNGGGGVFREVVDLVLQAKDQG